MTCAHPHPCASPPPEAGIIDSGAGIYDSGARIIDSGAGIIDSGATKITFHRGWMCVALGVMLEVIWGPKREPNSNIYSF